LRDPDVAIPDEGVNAGAPSSDASPVILRATDVHVRYRDGSRRRRRDGRVSPAPNRRRIHAVQGVNLELCAGDSVAVVGENGAGKSTLLGVLAGLIALDQGHVAAVARPRLLSIGATLQPLWTGRESVRVGLAALSVPRNEREPLERDIEEFTELGEALDRPVTTYSRGMRERLLFAINTSVPAKILLADEALGGADGRFRVRAEERIDAILRAAGALVIASHSRQLLERHCERAILIRRGKIAAEGSLREVLRAHEF
jgi:teichoic acid transport system ATP-binding protein